MTPMHERPEQRATRFSKRWWLGKAHSVFWIALATILIWIYADMEFTDEVKLKATLALNTSESKTVALLNETKFELSFTLSGSKTALSQFRRDLTAQGSELRYDVSQEYAPGNALVPAATLLEKAAGLAQRGITIKDIQPQAIPIHLDRLVTRNVPVDLDAQGATFRLKGKAPLVEVRVPESCWTRIQERLKGRLPRLRTKLVDLKDLSPDTPVVAEIYAVLEGEPVILSKKFVTFDVEAISPRITGELDVTLRLLTPTAWAEANNTTWQDYVFVPNAASEWRPKLKIEGAEPKDLTLDNIRAYLELTDDDKKGTDAWLTREVIVSFPPQSKLRLVGPAPKVQFRLEKRKAPVAAPIMP